MKIKAFFISIALLFLVVPVVSRASDETKDLSVSFSSAIWTKYVGSQGIVLHDQPVVQNDVFLSLKNGWYADFGLFSGLDDRSLSSNYGDEIDVTIGWNGKPTGKTNVDVGVIYIDGFPVFDAPRGGGARGDFIMPYANLSQDFTVLRTHTVTPFVRAEWLGPVDKNLGLNCRWYGTTGIKHNWRVVQWLNIVQHAAIVFDDGVVGKDRSFVGRYSVELRLSPADWVSVSPLMFKTIAPLTSMDDGRKKETILGAKISFAF